jgi:Putative beta-barrel porin-2, OmpL-like. bbp2
MKRTRNRARSLAAFLCTAPLLGVAEVNAQAAYATVAPVVQADTTDHRVDSTRAAQRDDAAPLLGIKISGYIETAFNASNRANERVIVGRLYERASNQFSLNALKLTLDRPFDPKKADAGFHADLVFGQNAPVLQSTGFNLGPNGDVYQLYGTLNLPTSNGNGVQIRVGRMATFLGLELIETPLNPNVSIGNAFIYAENFTQTGLSVEHRFTPVVDVAFRVMNGWDQVQDVNGRLSYMARLGLTPDAQSSVALAAFAGPEAADNDTAIRSGFEVLASRRMGRFTGYLQGDVGREQRNAALPDSTRDATWWAAGSWLVVDATQRVGVALRADYLSDRMAARTAGAFGLVGAPSHRLASATITLNIKAVPNVLLRPEIRYDRSNKHVFAQQTEQYTFGVNLAYVF